MASVTVKVNGRPYPIMCGDGEEDHLRYLAEFVDKKVKNLNDGTAAASEVQLLLMASLLVADDLAQAYETIEELKAAASDEGADKSSAQTAQWAEKIEALAETLENA